jgi:signal peptidase
MTMRAGGIAIARRGIGTLAIAALAIAALTLGAFVVPRVAGYETLVVLGSSMGDAHPKGSVVTVRPQSSDDLEVGDVILLRRAGSPPVLHRVVELRHEAGQVLVETKGDANATRDPGDTVLGDETLVVAWSVPQVGYVLRWAHTPLGWFLVQVVPAIALAAWLLAQLWREDLPELRRHVLRGRYA